MEFCSVGKCIFLQGELIPPNDTLNITVLNE